MDTFSRLADIAGQHRITNDGIYLAKSFGPYVVKILRYVIISPGM